MNGHGMRDGGARVGAFGPEWGAFRLCTPRPMTNIIAISELPGSGTGVIMELFTVGSGGWLRRLDGRKALARAVLGCTASNLLHHSTVPVMVCRSEAKR